MPSVEELACLNCTLAECDERNSGCYFYKPPPVKIAVPRRKYFAARYKDKRAVARIEAKAARRAIIEQLRLELYA